jgi:Na+-transporting NADH:ubiquinone oxidoreductase subunit D
MCISVLFVLIFSNLSISLMRNVIPGRIRIIVQLLVVATLVAIVDQVLQAYAYNVYKLITVFVGLIITNCIIMGRLEAFALANKPWPALLDAIGNGLGYAVILIPVAFFRELFGSGSLLGINILGENYPGNGVMMSPVGACIVLGLIIWFQRARNGYTEEA